MSLVFKINFLSKLFQIEKVYKYFCVKMIEKQDFDNQKEILLFISLTLIDQQDFLKNSIT